MDMRKHMNMLVGFFLISAVVILCMGFALFLNVRGVFNPEYKLYAVFENGIGIRNGTAVLFNGVKVGDVHNVELINGNSDKKLIGKVFLTLEIDEKYRNFINDGSTAYVMRDKNLVSDRVVNIESLNPHSRVLGHKDTLNTSHTRDVESVLSSVSLLIVKVDDLISKAGTVVNRINDTSSSMGALLGSRHMYNNVMSNLKSLSHTIYQSQRVIKKMDGMGSQVEKVLPVYLSKIDSSLDNVSEMAGDAKDMVDNLSNVSKDVVNMTQEVETLLKLGKKEMSNAGELIDALSDVWIIRGKIRKKREKDFPILNNNLGL